MKKFEDFCGNKHLNEIYLCIRKKTAVSNFIKNYY